MYDINKIRIAIDEFLEQKNKTKTTPVEINPYLEAKGLLKDSASRPGAPIRKLLRKKEINNAFKFGAYWEIHHSKSSGK